MKRSVRRLVRAGGQYEGNSMPFHFGPLSDCPRCNKASSFGRCLIGSEGLIFICKACRHSVHHRLPPVKKKIIYLDQFALSNMIKLKADPFWSDLHRRLMDLAAKNLITCPQSFSHRDESKLTVSLREQLKAMYREIAGSDEFLRPPHIEEAQLARLLKKFMGKPDEDDESWRDWSERDPHQWSDILHVHVDFGDIEAQIIELRNSKEGIHADMKKQCDEWRQNPQSFDQDVESNYACWRSNMAQNRLEIAIWLAQWVQALDENESKPGAVVVDFFESGMWKEAPFVWLWVRIWAKIAELARNRKGPRKPQRGDYFDSQVLANFAPYCDAMFIDRGYRDIARDGRIDVLGRFGTQCFSEQTRDDFLAYLRGLDDGMTTEHRKALEFTYPSGFPSPSNSPT